MQPIQQFLPAWRGSLVGLSRSRKDPLERSARTTLHVQSRMRGNGHVPGQQRPRASAEDPDHRVGVEQVRHSHGPALLARTVAWPFEGRIVDRAPPRSPAGFAMASSPEVLEQGQWVRMAAAGGPHRNGPAVGSVGSHVTSRCTRKPAGLGQGTMTVRPIALTVERGHTRWWLASGGALARGPGKIEGLLCRGVGPHGTHGRGRRSRARPKERVGERRERDAAEASGLAEWLAWRRARYLARSS